MASRSHRASRYWYASPPPTAIPVTSPRRTHSISAAAAGQTSASVTGSTTAWARRWPGSKPKLPSRHYSAATPGCGSRSIVTPSNGPTATVSSCGASPHSRLSSGRADTGPARQSVPPRIKETPMTITDRPVDNGVNVEALLGAREALTAAPEAAQFTWRATCTWRSGTHSRSTVAGFTGLGTEQEHRTTYEFDVDHPECFASADNGATPVEFVLVGLVGCLTAGVASVAQHRGIQLRSVTAAIEGDMNVLGILGADPGIRNGFESVTVRFSIDADASRDELEALLAQAQKRSAVFDVVTNPVKVLVELA